MKFFIENNQDKLEIKDEMIEQIKRVCEKTLEFEGLADIDFEVSVTFTDNENIQNLNRIYRNIDSATDVLSFPMIDFTDEFIYEEGFEYSLGDIVISGEKAEEQAVEYGHSLERELCFLACHSMLHLLGYDHMTDEDEEEMKESQNKILDALGIYR